MGKKSKQLEEELRLILLNILRTGLLRIRMDGWNGRADECAIEADHLHNLPGIAKELKVELLSHYYNTTRSSFIKQAKIVQGFEEDWKRLGEILAEMQSKTAKDRSQPPSAKSRAKALWVTLTPFLRRKVGKRQN
jgi:hypothetical protein